MTLSDQLVEHVIERNKLQKNYLRHAQSQLTMEDKERLDQYIQYCQSLGVGMDELVSSYDLISRDTFKEELYFQKHGKYRYSTLVEVNERVYQNANYMTQYMHGLAVSQFLWPNHFGMLQYFRKVLPTDKNGEYLEIGPGHGFYFMEAMRRSKFNDFLGIDISPTSARITQELIGSGFFGKYDSYRVEVRNFLEYEPLKPVDAFVMGEVLEHVEKPEIFLKKIRKITHEGSFIFLTTCWNSPAIDHIYLFHNWEEIESLYRSCGFSIQEKHVLPYAGLTLQETEERKLAVNVATLLSHSIL